MIYFELFAPRGALSQDQHREVGERFIVDVMSEDTEHASSLLDGARGACTAVVHETATWVVGGPGGSETALRFLVRVSVPGAWRKDMSAWIIDRVTAVLAEYVDDPRRLYEQPHAWVQVVGVPERSYGLYGQAMTSTDITRLATAGFRDSPDSALAPRNGLDPVCGMAAPLNDNAITLDHDGTTYAFCSIQCRTVFAEDKGIALATGGAA